MYECSPMPFKIRNSPAHVVSYVSLVISSVPSFVITSGFHAETFYTAFFSTKKGAKRSEIL
jgi:hypothetical protein